MNLLDLVKEEIIEMGYAKVNREANPSTSYEVHCSKIFEEVFFEEFLKYGFVLSKEEILENRKDFKITKYQVPFIGYLNMIVEDRTGYEIKLKTE